jgi:outer membrane protein assembly factor BamE (lipoprotein component of BamABCDE complex)
MHIKQNLLIKKNKLIILISILVSLSIFLIKQSSSKKENIVQDNLLPTKNIDNIVPGKFTEDEVIRKLGKPSSTLISGSKKTLFYISNNPNIDHEIEILDNKVNIIRKQVTEKDNIKKKDLLDKYGTPEYLLYGPIYTARIVLYAYPNRGLAFLASENSDFVLNIWYFIPTDLDNFIKKYAQEYSLETSKIMEDY